MRALRGGYDPQALWLSVGGFIGFSAATVLFAILCEQTRELGEILNSQAQSGPPYGKAELRDVRQAALEDARTPQGRGFSEQLAREFANALPVMPQEIARFSGGPLASRVPARVGRLRGYGNSIVPQLAAEFIKAVMP